MNVTTDGPFIHRVVNPDRAPFHLVAVELRRAGILGRRTSDRPAASGFVQVYDHPRLRAWRLVLEPAQSAPALKYEGTGVRIFVRGDQLTVSDAGYPGQALVVRPGDFEQLRTGSTIALTNDGTSIVELIDVELK